MDCVGRSTADRKHSQVWREQVSVTSNADAGSSAELILHPRWKLVAKDVGSRTGDQCWKRWNDSLDPTLNHSPWTPREDEVLQRAVDEIGRCWSRIAATRLQGRSGLACKNRMDHLDRRKRRTKMFCDRSVARQRTKNNAIAVLNSTAANGYGQPLTIRADYQFPPTLQPSLTPPTYASRPTPLQHREELHVSPSYSQEVENKVVLQECQDDNLDRSPSTGVPALQHDPVRLSEHGTFVDGSPQLSESSHQLGEHEPFWPHPMIRLPFSSYVSAHDSFNVHRQPLHVSPTFNVRDDSKTVASFHDLKLPHRPEWLDASRSPLHAYRHEGGLHLYAHHDKSPYRQDDGRLSGHFTSITSSNPACVSPGQITQQPAAAATGSTFQASPRQTQGFTCTIGHQVGWPEQHSGGDHTRDSHTYDQVQNHHRDERSYVVSRCMDERQEDVAVAVPSSSPYDEQNAGPFAHTYSPRQSDEPVGYPFAQRPSTGMTNRAMFGVTLYSPRPRSEPTYTTTGAPAAFGMDAAKKAQGATVYKSESSSNVQLE